MTGLFPLTKSSLERRWDKKDGLHRELLKTMASLPACLIFIEQVMYRAIDIAQVSRFGDGS